MQMYYDKPGRLSDAVQGRSPSGLARGALVHFMYDAIRSDRMREECRRDLTDAGVRIAAFRPFRWRDLDRLGHGAHTRVVVVDGRIGYTGGFGLDDKWLGNGGRRGEWRETNVRFTGPAVVGLAAPGLPETYPFGL